MPSNIRPSTRAVSATVSFLPSWISPLPRYSGWAPSSMQATVKAQRVRVDGFSKISAMLLPESELPRVPAFLAALRRADSASR
jgi:hypothetical protein